MLGIRDLNNKLGYGGGLNMEHLVVGYLKWKNPRILRLLDGVLRGRKRLRNSPVFDLPFIYLFGANQKEHTIVRCYERKNERSMQMWVDISFTYFMWKVVTLASNHEHTPWRLPSFTLSVKNSHSETYKIEGLA